MFLNNQYSQDMVQHAELREHPGSTQTLTSTSSAQLVIPLPQIEQ